MNREIKICQNCKKDFVIEPEDFKFYEKIGVPSPTFCPECRLVRKLVFRNERALYKRTCDSCEENLISIYSQESSLTVYCQKCWWGDGWDPMSFSMEINESVPFLEQFKSLMTKVPVMSDFNVNSVNSEYCNYAANCKNCYLMVGGRDNENVLYADRLFFSKDSMDLYVGSKLELCYENVQCVNSYQLFFSQFSEDCNNSWFLYDCKNCQNCFGCVNLRGQQYHIFNKPYSKEEYFKKIDDMELGSYVGLSRAKEQAEAFFDKSMRRYARIINSPGSTGDNLHNAKNCKNCFDITGIDSENSKYSHHIGVGVKDSYDNYGAPRAEDVYETLAIGFESNENSKYRFSYFVKGSTDIWYSYNCVSSQSLFGCVGIRSKKYCILNKQYSKEEYEKLVPQIIKRMNDNPYKDEKGRAYKYGEFFPPELSPFAYNETIAQEYFPLAKKEAEEKGYDWKDVGKKNYTVTLKSDDIPNHIRNVDDKITKQVIACEHAGQCNEQCTTAFKVISDELAFYKKMNIPVPKLCPNCRHYQRLKKRNPLKLWKRQCMCDYEIHKNTVKHDHHPEGKCPNEFETSYSPDRKEIVYCESCYNSEVA